MTIPVQPVLTCVRFGQCGASFLEYCRYTLLLFPQGLNTLVTETEERRLSVIPFWPFCGVQVHAYHVIAAVRGY